MHRRTFNAVVHLVSSRREFYYIRNARLLTCSGSAGDTCTAAMVAAVVVAAAVASHRDAAYVYVCVCVGAIPVARTIGHLCGRTENDRNSSHYSRSKKEVSLSLYLSISLTGRGRDRPDFRLRRGFPLRCPIAHGTGRDELEIEAFSRGLSGGGLGGFCWLGAEMLER